MCGSVFTLGVDPCPRNGPRASFVVVVIVALVLTTRVLLISCEQISPRGLVCEEIRPNKAASEATTSTVSFLAPLCVVLVYATSFAQCFIISRGEGQFQNGTPGGMGAPVDSFVGSGG